MYACTHADRPTELCATILQDFMVVDNRYTFYEAGGPASNDAKIGLTSMTDTNIEAHRRDAPFPGFRRSKVLPFTLSTRRGTLCAREFGDAMRGMYLPQIPQNALTIANGKAVSNTRTNA